MILFIATEKALVFFCTFLSGLRLASCVYFTFVVDDGFFPERPLQLFHVFFVVYKKNTMNSSTRNNVT